MAKTKTLFVCQECGSQSPRWEGRCSQCMSWNSYVEEMAGPRASKESAVLLKSEPVLLKDIESQNESRYQTNILELDRVLGGGIVPGSVTLIGGDPGIGKSTLSLQIGCTLSEQGQKVLYVSGEESVKQTALRADRVSPKDKQSLYIVNQVDLNVIQEYIN
ncbi:MAG: DNA repair protein RadA/Sms, partial [Candidatus Omnitrophota bacterium]